MKRYFYLFLLVCGFVESSPYLSFDDGLILKKIDDLEIRCNFIIVDESSYPVSIYAVNHKINLYKKISNDQTCIDGLYSLQDYLYDRFNKPILKIGFQSKVNDLFFQEKDSRFYQQENSFIEYSKTGSIYSVNVKLREMSNEILFDESYISILVGKNALSLGRKSLWWSPSDISSLILSNSARPSMGIELKNYHPINFNKSFLSAISNIEYTFFLNKLEKERHVPNAFLFGNRVSFNIGDFTRLSLMRVAQYGGDGRPKDIDTFLKLLAGIDNADENLGFNEQPGNQLAGIDLNHKFLKNKNGDFYFQVIGEDEAGFLPSRTFYLIGMSKKIKHFNGHTKLIVDYQNTETNYENYTYSHGIYKDGYRYYGSPIGAAIDADSQKITIGIDKFINSNSLIKIRYGKSKINNNNNPNNFWSNSSFDSQSLKISMDKKVKNFDLNFVLIYRDTTLFRSNRFNGFFTLKYAF